MAADLPYLCDQDSEVLMSRDAFQYVLSLPGMAVGMARSQFSAVELHRCCHPLISCDMLVAWLTIMIGIEPRCD